MPGYDGKGPEGTGPNGRGLGPCGEGAYGRGRGFFGFHRGRGRRGRFFDSWNIRTPVNESEALKAEKSWLERRLKSVSDALGEEETK
jgi:hypothetical protein